MAELLIRMVREVFLDNDPVEQRLKEGRNGAVTLRWESQQTDKRLP